MHDRLFDNPVFVTHGDGPIKEIRSISEALCFLENWPEELRGSIYRTAIQACEHVRNGRLPLSSARACFASFAGSARILDEVATTHPYGDQGAEAA